MLINNNDNDNDNDNENNNNNNDNSNNNNKNNDNNNNNNNNNKNNNSGNKNNDNNYNNDNNRNMLHEKGPRRKSAPCHTALAMYLYSKSNFRHAIGGWGNGLLFNSQQTITRKDDKLALLWRIKVLSENFIEADIWYLFNVWCKKKHILVGIGFKDYQTRS